MKIAYWSPFHGQAGTTSNMLATAMMAGMVYHKQCLLAQTHFIYNNMEAPLIGSNSMNYASRDFFLDVGLDSLMRNFKAAKLTKEIIENCCITLPNTKISVLPGTSKSNRDSFEYEMGSVFLNLLRTVEEFYSVVFVDVSAGRHPLSLKIMKDSDLIVVNLSQNMGFAEYYFDTYKELTGRNVFYLFGNYDCDSKYNIYNIRRRYHKFMNQNNSGVIPYNTAFHDAQCDGRIMEFMRDNLRYSRKDENRYFMQNIIRTADKLMNKAGIEIPSLMQDAYGS